MALARSLIELFQQLNQEDGYRIGMVEYIG